MNNDLILGARTLAKGRIRHVPPHLGRRVECLSGALWITQDGDLRDIVLGAGRERSPSTVAATRCSAPSPTHATCCSTRCGAAADRH